MSVSPDEEECLQHVQDLLYPAGVAVSFRRGCVGAYAELRVRGLGALLTTVPEETLARPAEEISRALLACVVEELDRVRTRVLKCKVMRGGATATLVARLDDEVPP